MKSKTQEKPVARVAIAGATGAVGGALTTLMSKDDIALVGLTRNPGKANFPAGVEAAAVDFSNPATLLSALSGSDSLFLAQGGSPDQVANEIALIDAAVKAGVRHIVKLSAFGPASTLYPFNLHPQIEAYLAKQTVAYTVIRPTAFANLLRLIAPHVAAGTWGGAVGDGRNNYIDVRDIAEVARLALLAEVEPDTARVYHLTGPRSWSIPELTAEFSRLLGKDVRYQARTEQEQRELLLSTGLDAGRAGLVLGLDKLFRDCGISETTLTVEQLTGRAPRPLTEWLSDNIQLFQAK